MKVYKIIIITLALFIIGCGEAINSQIVDADDFSNKNFNLPSQLNPNSQINTADSNDFRNELQVDVDNAFRTLNHSRTAQLVLKNLNAVLQRDVVEITSLPEDLERLGLPAITEPQQSKPVIRISTVRQLADRYRLNNDTANALFILTLVEELIHSFDLLSLSSEIKNTITEDFSRWRNGRSAVSEETFTITSLFCGYTNTRAFLVLYNVAQELRIPSNLIGYSSPQSKISLCGELYQDESSRNTAVEAVANTATFNAFVNFIRDKARNVL